MKPPKQNFDRSLMPRISRQDEMLHSEGEGQAWAVSYSDLLMVLMSFFILFFSFETPEKAQQGLSQIAFTLQRNPAAETGTGDLAHQVPLDQQLRSAFAGPEVEVQSEGDVLHIHFLSDAFASGDFRLTQSLEDDLRRFAELLKPFREMVELQVVGHADKRPLVQRNLYLQDNFDLSAMRALQALKFLSVQGIPQERLSAQGSASNERISRSLSVRIRMAKETSP